MNKVSNITRLGEFVKPFTGKTVEDAIKAAKEWSMENGTPLIGNYYHQVKLGKLESILVDLKTNKREDT